jgi:hypothetical protein
MLSPGEPGRIQLVHMVLWKVMPDADLAVWIGDASESALVFDFLRP